MSEPNKLADFVTALNREVEQGDTRNIVFADESGSLLADFARFSCTDLALVVELRRRPEPVAGDEQDNNAPGLTADILSFVLEASPDAMLPIVPG